MQRSLCFLFASLLLLGSSYGSVSSTSFSDEVKNLPGLDGDYCWKSFSGYLDVPGNKSLFHWYHEAVTDASDKPLLLWLNGGPGCSSLGGMFTELGPFVVDASGSVTFNPFSWNKVANVLFMEQPAGVGFSYPAAPTDDATTANDTYEGLLAFLALHPELQGRDFYIAGESYGGHYVPNTAKAVQDGNAQGDALHIPLKGFAVGNGYTDWQLDFNANVENGRFHALTSQALFEAANKACDGDYARCFWPRPNVTCPAACDSAVQAATQDAMDGSIDIYDIYEDVCPAGQQRTKTQQYMLMQERRAQHLRKQQEKTGGLLGGTTISPIFATCEDDYSSAYLNLPEVQHAIGIRKGTIPGGNWSDCGLNGMYHFNYESEIPNYQKWVGEGALRMLIYNGDADYILSHMGNAAWINDGLQLNKTAEWTKWRGSDKQVAGYFEQYETAGVPFTFLTVKGAGHMVPKDRPQHALDMITQFLAGADYDKVPASAPQLLCK